MAAYSYANLFGTTGAGRQGSKAGISTLFGQQATPQGDDEEMMRKKQQQAQQQGAAVPQPTFAEKQKMGQARPAPPPTAAQVAPTAQPTPLVQRVKKQLGETAVAVPGGRMITKTAENYYLPQKAPATPVAAQTPAPTAAATGAGTMAPMKPPVTVTPAGTPVGAPVPTAPAAMTGASLAQTLQQQLTGLLQPGGYTDTEFERLKAAQEANLRAEYGAEQQRLNEELSRRGLSASTIGGGRMGDLAGQQARALATMQASLLGEQAQLRQRARETGITALSDLTRTVMTNEQQQAETRLKEQLGMSEIGGVMYKRGPDGQLVPMTDAENKQIQTLAAREVARKYGVAEAELTGMFEGKETLPARTQRQNLALQLAQVLAQSDDPDVLKNIMPYIYEAFGIKPPTEDTGDEDTGGDGTPRGRTATPRGTSTVGLTPGGTTNVPGGGTPKLGVPLADRDKGPEEEVEPRGPKKPSLGRPADVEVTPAGAGIVDVAPTEQPVLLPAEEPAAPPPPAPAPAPVPAPRPRTLEEDLVEILGGDAAMPILLPAEEPAPVPAPAPRRALEPVAEEAPAAPPRRTILDAIAETLGIPTIPAPAPVPEPEPVVPPVVEQKPKAEPVNEALPVALPPAPEPILLPAEEPAPAPAPTPAPEAPTRRERVDQDEADRAEQERIVREAIGAARRAQEEADRQAAEAEQRRLAERLAAKTPEPAPTPEPIVLPVAEPEPILLPAPEPVAPPTMAPEPYTPYVPEPYTPTYTPAPYIPQDAAPIIQQLAETLGLPVPVAAPAPEPQAPMPMSQAELEQALLELLTRQEPTTASPYYGNDSFYLE